jgi:hypothetical protein
LQAVLSVATDGLNMRPLIRGDAHVGPGRRNGELLDACLQRLIAQSLTFGIGITETPSTTPATQAKICGLDVVQAITAAKFLASSGMIERETRHGTRKFQSLS